MKKFISAAVIAAAMLTLTACEVKHPAVPSAPESVTGERVPQIEYTPDSELEIWDVLPEIPETPAEALIYKEIEGGICVTGVHGVTEVNIPAQLGGKPVTRVDLTEAQITELILPDTVRVLSLSGTVKYLNLPAALEQLYFPHFDEEKQLEALYCNDGLKKLDSDLAECRNLKTVRLAESLVEIERYALSYSAIERIDIPDSVTEIGGRVFAGCEKLKTVKLPKGLSAISDSMFIYCSALSEIAIPDTVRSIGSYAFENCGLLTSVTIPNGVEELDRGQFYGCESITEITIPDSVRLIGSSVFADCPALKSVTFGSGLKEIGKGAFHYCYGLTEIVLPDGVEYVMDSFANCTHLEKVSLPDSLKLIHRNAFRHAGSVEVSYNGRTYGAGELEQLYGIFYKGGVLVRDNTAIDCLENAVEIAAPQGVTEIGDYAFSYSETLKKAELPDTLTVIGDGAFNKCAALSEVNIPGGVTEIGAYAFSGCASLEKIALPDGLTELDKLAFANGSNDKPEMAFRGEITFRGKTYSADELEELFEAAAPQNT